MIKNRTFSITGHMVIKNEDRWVWFAIMSVIDFLDKMIIYDTGSKDHTNEIVQEIVNKPEYRNKITYEKIGSVSAEEFHRVRQKQIDITDTDYFMVIDGDEIWYKNSLEELNTLLSDRPKLVATRFINACGDVFHYRFDSRETYCINGETGAITIRIILWTFLGISCGGVYGVEGYIDEDGIAVQEKGYTTVVQDGRYFHTSLLNRSSAQNGDFSIKYRRNKIKADWDAKFSNEFTYPEVFYVKELPEFVKSPFEKDHNLIRVVYHLLRKIKRVVKK